MNALGPAQSRVALFEQPTPKYDLDALRAVREQSQVKVAADESACSAADVLALIAAQAAQTKSPAISLKPVPGAKGLLG